VIAIAKQAKRFWSDDRGATAIEYALIASIMGLMLIPVIANITSSVGGLFVRVQGYFDTILG
jgi:Flp pilus assembly pilin Flp